MHEIEELLMFKSARKTQHVTQIIEVDLRAYRFENVAVL